MSQKPENGEFGGARYREWKRWDADNFGSYDRVLATAFRLELARSGVVFERPPSILEIGFGNGSFACWVRDQGWNYLGIEIDPELVKRGISKNLEVYGTDVDLTTVAAGRKFDGVIAFDVLEHLDIDDIVSLLRTIKHHLAPNGRIIARVPSGDSPFSRAIQYGDITHRSVLGSGIVQQIADMAGLRAAQIRAPAFPLLGVGPVRALRRLGVLALRNLIKPVVNLAFHDNQPRVIEPNMVIVLVRQDI